MVWPLGPSSRPLLVPPRMSPCTFVASLVLLYYGHVAMRLIVELHIPETETETETATETATETETATQMRRHAHGGRAFGRVGTHRC